MEQVGYNERSVEIVTLDNVLRILKTKRLKLSYVYQSKKYWILCQRLDIQLSNNDIITIPKGFKWDLSSSPMRLWGLFPPFGDFLIAALIHDYLYIEKKDVYDRKFVDKEMLIWSNVVNGNKLDNWIRYGYVRALGWVLYNKKKS